MRLTSPQIPSAVLSSKYTTGTSFKSSPSIATLSAAFIIDDAAARSIDAAFCNVSQEYSISSRSSAHRLRSSARDRNSADRHPPSGWNTDRVSGLKFEKLLCHLQAISACVGFFFSRKRLASIPNAAAASDATHSDGVSCLSAADISSKHL